MKRALAACLLLMLAAPAMARQHHLLIVAGIGGTPHYDEQFANQAKRMADAARAAGLAENRIVVLGGAGGPADKKSIRATISRIAGEAGPRDRFFLLLIGHGNPRGDSAVFNLPGPDLSAGELAEALEAFGDRLVTVVNAASASGPFVAPLSGPNRVLITATSSGREYQATLFGEYFIAAFDTPGADRDKDERISMLEAFDYARREVKRSYEGEKRLLIEHALLDDNGDGEGSLEAGEFEPDGALAHHVYLRQPLTAEAGASGEMLALQERKQALEESIAELKRQREVLPRDDYYLQLESLLVDLALLNRRLRVEGD
ncbi:MAG: C13 family peptidase [Gammaproteobacteria bacterium]|jgi:hypothetical protein